MYTNHVFSKPDSLDIAFYADLSAKAIHIKHGFLEMQRNIARRNENNPHEH